MQLLPCISTVGNMRQSDKSALRTSELPVRARLRVLRLDRPDHDAAHDDESASLATRPSQVYACHKFGFMTFRNPRKGV